MARSVWKIMALAAEEQEHWFSLERPIESLTVEQLVEGDASASLRWNLNAQLVKALREVLLVLLVLLLLLGLLYTIGQGFIILFNFWAEEKSSEKHSYL
ncbi:unnamed protein product [Lampetra planeri]